MSEAAAKEFRRASITINHVETIEASKLEGILGLLGQPFDIKKLQARIEQLQDGEGHLDLAKYTQIIKEFVTCPAAEAKLGGDEFVFKHLINRSDFGTP